KGPNGKKGPKFNMYWIYAIILLALIGLNIFGSGMNTTQKSTNFLDFKENYLDKGLVKKVVVVNKELAEVYLNKPEKAATPSRHRRGPAPFTKEEAEPDLIFDIGTYDAFDRKFQEIMDEYAEEGRALVPVEVEYRGSLLRDIMSFGWP